MHRLRRRVNYGGLVVAAVGFLLTRYAVIKSFQMGTDTLGFLVGEVLFLAIGLGLTVFGIALTVSSVSAAESGLVARWCLLGTVSMGAIVATTATESLVAGSEMLAVPGGGLVSHVLIGGATGGTLTGVWAVANRRQRHALGRQRDRLTLLNRILRHEVLNKVSIVEGYASLPASSRDPGHADIISRNARHIESAIQEVGFLTRTIEQGSTGGSRPLRPMVDRAVDAARTAHPNATFTVEWGDVGALHVGGDDHLSTAIENLLDNAATYDDDPEPTVTIRVEGDRRRACVHVADEGPGMPPEAVSLLTSRDLPDYDDPSVGFGLTVTRLLLDDVGGRATVDTDTSGSTVTLELQRVSTEDPLRSTTTDSAYGVSATRLGDVAVASLVAGVVMGGVLQFFFGDIAIIGALYGVSNATVGWVTHLFHSIVFGVVFAALLSVRRIDVAERSVVACTALGVGFGLVLWLVAAGVVMPLWLQAVGIPAPVPNLQLPSLLGHVVWGTVVGGLFSVSDRGQVPWSQLPM